MKRQRGRTRNPNNASKQHNPNRAMESNGPGVKVRGAVSTILEKYQQLARDAALSGDPVMAENYLQFAEHYFRVMREQAAQREKREEEQNAQRAARQAEYDARKAQQQAQQKAQQQAQQQVRADTEQAAPHNGNDRVEKTSANQDKNAAAPQSTGTDVEKNEKRPKPAAPRRRRSAASAASAPASATEAAEAAQGAPSPVQSGTGPMDVVTPEAIAAESAAVAPKRTPRRRVRRPASEENVSAQPESDIAKAGE